MVGFIILDRHKTEGLVSIFQCYLYYLDKNEHLPLKPKEKNVPSNFGLELFFLILSADW